MSAKAPKHDGRLRVVVNNQSTYAEERAARENVESLLEGKVRELYFLSQSIAEKDYNLKQSDIVIRQLTQQLEETQLELRKLVRYDSLTELPNRQQLDEDIQREIARASRYDRKLALLYVNFDFFRKINGNFGHEVGDYLLKEAAGRLHHLLRIEDSAARLEGDQFALLLTEIENPHDAGIVAHRIVEKMAEPYLISGHTIIASVSVGIAFYPETGTDLNVLHTNAEIALRNAKNMGRKNYQFFTDGLDMQQTHKLEIEAELHFALERKEFYLVYQPCIDIQTGRMRGMEVLLRWKHPSRGIIPTDEFIPVAEDTGFILPIGEWVLLTACAQFAEWRMKNPNLNCTLAVNISPQQLQHKNLVSYVLHVLKVTMIPPQLLEFEITETAMGNLLEQVEDTLFQLREIGVRFSIDDFGTGYSSLKRLKDFPIQSIKIDRSFVSDINLRVSDNLIIKSTIDLAKEMGLDVIAEGVETPAQLQFLLKSRCPQVQGYLYSEPLTVEEMGKYIRNNLLG